MALSGFTPKYGARPITGVIRQQLRRLIIGGEARLDTVLALDKAEGSEAVTWTSTQTGAPTLEAVTPAPATPVVDADTAEVA